jgi:oxaloacetate decarboxylase alpha subunit
VNNGSRDIALEPPPLEPMVPKLRKRYPGLPDDELVLRSLFPDEQVDAMLAAQPKDHGAAGVRNPLVDLVAGAINRRGAAIYVRQGSFELRATSS